jgi:16S rRNA pseudouridine516 synthase
MLKNIEAIIFDLDGTLVDSMWIWEDIDMEYLERYKFDLPEDLQDEIEGMGFTETAVFFKEKFNIPATVEEIKKDWNNLARQKYETEVPLKEGAINILDYAKENHIKLGIASSNSRELIEVVLKSHNIHSYFDTIVTSCEAKKGKPAPDVYLMAAKNLNIENEKCLVFEDVPAGIKAGLAANMRVCAIEDEFSMKAKKEKIELADYYIKNYNDIPLAE